MFLLKVKSAIGFSTSGGTMTGGSVFSVFLQEEQVAVFHDLNILSCHLQNKNK
jgi:hypothetical protein